MRIKRPHEHRWRERRLEVDFQVVIRGARQEPITCRVLNISKAGFLAEAVLPIGTRVAAEIEGLDPADAEVRWSLGGKSGLAFIAPTGALLDLIETAQAGSRKVAGNIAWTDGIRCPESAGDPA